jgi:hypothetical protein
MESITNIYPRPYCKLSNALKESDKKRTPMGCYLLYDYRERPHVLRNRFRGIHAWGP